MLLEYTFYSNGDLMIVGTQKGQEVFRKQIALAPKAFSNEDVDG